MTEASPIDTGAWTGFERVAIQGSAATLSARVGGPDTGPAVLFSHSILTNSGIWPGQAALLARKGYRVICIDTRGHGLSQASAAPYTMDQLADDVVAVIDSLEIRRIHYVGVSQGGMTGLGLGVRHPKRLESLCIVAARADAPAPFAAAWDDRIAIARRDGGVDALAQPTADRWFGGEYLARRPDVAEALLSCIKMTSAEGFIGCAQAIQKLDYLAGVAAIPVPVTLAIGTRDTALLQPMRDLARIMPGAQLVEIADAGHLPQIDRPDAFDEALLRHLTFRENKTLS